MKVILLSTLLAILWLVILSSIYRNKSLEQIMAQYHISDGKGKKSFKKAFFHRFPQTLTRLGQTQKVSYKKLLQKYPLTILTAQEGGGKTTLMEQMSYHKRTTLFHPFRSSIYCNLPYSTKSLPSTLFELRSQLTKKRKKHIFLFLDGFDEVKEVYEGKTGEQLLSPVLEMSRYLSKKNKHLHIVIATQKNLFTVPLQTLDSHFLFLELAPLTKKQLFRFYKYLPSSRIAKKTGLKHLRSHLNKEGDLALPFYLKQINTLYNSNPAIDYFSWSPYQILEYLINHHYPEKEYTRYIQSSPKQQAISLSQYKALSKQHFFESTLLVMKNQTPYIKNDYLSMKCRQYFNKKSLMITKTTTHIKNKGYYYNHSLYLHFFLAQYLSKPETSYKYRNLWMNKKRLPSVFYMYTMAIKKEQTIYQNLLSCVDLKTHDPATLFTMDQIHIVPEPSMEITTLLRYLVKVEQFHWKQIYLDKLNTHLLKQKGILELENSTLSQLSSLNTFGPLSQLYLDNNQLSSIVNYHYLRYLNTLDITANPFHHYEQLNSLNLNTLYISINTEKDLFEVLQSARFQTLIVDVDNLSPLCLTIYQLRKTNGVDIFLRKGIISSQEIILESIKYYDYQLMDFIKIMTLDSIYNPKNPNSLYLKTLISESLMTYEKGELSLTQWMIYTLYQLNREDYKKVSDKAFIEEYSPFYDEEILEGLISTQGGFDLELLDEMENTYTELPFVKLIPYSFANLHMAAYHYNKEEYKSCIYCLEESNIILKRIKQKREEQLLLIHTLSKCITLQPYYDMYFKSHQTLGNDILEHEPKEPIIVDTVKGLIPLPEFHIQKKSYSQWIEVDSILGLM